MPGLWCELWHSKRGERWGISIKLLFRARRLGEVVRYDGIEGQSEDWASSTQMARWGGGVGSGDLGRG